MSVPLIMIADLSSTIDSELRLVAALRRAARERGGPLPSIDVADALLDECRDLTERVRKRRATSSIPASHTSSIAAQRPFP